MSAMNRSDLKALIKQCLLELLSEGLGNVAAPAPGRVTEARRRPAFDPRLDTPKAKPQNQALTAAVKEAARGNPVMADLLADTALTTLQTQLSHGDTLGRPSPGTGVSRMPMQEQFTGEVEDVFGAGAAPQEDGSSHWSDLAFMPSKKSA